MGGRGGLAWEAHPVSPVSPSVTLLCGIGLACVTGQPRVIRPFLETPPTPGRGFHPPALVPGVAGWVSSCFKHLTLSRSCDHMRLFRVFWVFLGGFSPLSLVALATIQSCRPVGRAAGRA